MKLIITVTDEIIDELNKKAFSSEIHKKFLETLEKNTAYLKPLYFNSDDPELQKYFVVDIKSEHTASSIIEELWKSGAITSAYIKPKDETPFL